MKLTELPKPSFFKGRKDQHYQVSHLEGDALVVERLTEMGFEPGQDIEVLGRLPFGGPFLVRTRSISLALRREEAEAIVLQIAAPLRVTP